MKKEEELIYILKINIFKKLYYCWSLILYRGDVGFIQLKIKELAGLIRDLNNCRLKKRYKKNLAESVKKARPMSHQFRLNSSFFQQQTG